MESSNLKNTKIGNYLVKSRIGSGTFGSVYTAVFLPTNTKVALKVIDIMEDSESRQRRHLIMIARELYILQKLSRMSENQYTIKLLDLFTNKEAETDVNQLSTIYMFSTLEPTDLSTMMANGTDFDY